MAYASNAISWNVNYGYNSNYFYPQQPYVSKTAAAEEDRRRCTTLTLEEAKYFAECHYGGICAYCGYRINAGDAIWWRRDDLRDRSSIWCGTHKTNPDATAPAEDHNKENDMAQRQDFTFPYTGAEIAASLETKAAVLEAKIHPVVVLDDTTLDALGYTSESRREELRKDKQEKQDSKNKGLSEQATKLRKEAIPYAKASKQSFDIDLEDIEHFGLNATDAPARKTRKPRQPKPSAPLVESAGGSVG